MTPPERTRDRADHHIPDLRPATARVGPGTEDHGRVWPFLVVGALLLGLVLFFAPKDEVEVPPEPVDPTTRAACRGWHVVLAATGIEDVGDLRRFERIALADDFIARAETVALTRNAEQETYLAVVDAIAGAREVRDARTSTDVYWALDRFADNLAAVAVTCEQT